MVCRTHMSTHHCDHDNRNRNRHVAGQSADQRNRVPPRARPNTCQIHKHYSRAEVEDFASHLELEIKVVLMGRPRRTWWLQQSSESDASRVTLLPAARSSPGRTRTAMLQPRSYHRATTSRIVDAGLCQIQETFEKAEHMGSGWFFVGFIHNVVQTAGPILPGATTRRVSHGRSASLALPTQATGPSASFTKSWRTSLCRKQTPLRPGLYDKCLKLNPGC